MVFDVGGKLLQVEVGCLLVEHLAAEKMLIYDLVTC